MMRTNRVQSTIIIAVILFLVVFSLNFFKSEIKSFFYFVSSPVQKAFWQGGQKISGFSNFLSNLSVLQTKNQELEAKNTQLLAENAWLKEFQKENEVLRQALNLQFQKEFKLVLGQTISQDLAQDFILIDKGSKDGIKVGFPVITSKKILCGRISEVYDDFSRIMLISSEASSFDAKVSDQDIFGVVKGKGGLNLEITLVSKDKEIKTGDQIVTSPLGGIFPKGLLIGEIKDVNKKDIEPFQSSTITPFFGTEDLNMVFVILDSQ